MELLEKAYASGSVEPEAYSKSCFRLISQFKTTEQALMSDGSIKSSDDFMARYQMSCPRAAGRLRDGAPATTMHRSGENINESVTVAETVQVNIYLNDCKLHERMRYLAVHIYAHLSLSLSLSNFDDGYVYNIHFLPILFYSFSSQLWMLLSLDRMQ